MLVENKFLFISLPRGASTAFEEACILHRFDIKHANSYYDFIYENDKVYQHKIHFPIPHQTIIENRRSNKFEIDTNKFGKENIIYHKFSSHSVGCCQHMELLLSEPIK